MDEFILGTDGHKCFLCSETCCVSVKRENGSASSTSLATHSIQYLYRYLKMDMRKVFNEDGPISPQLLAKVEKARLKVELCKDCISLNETFSRMYRKLEKIDMEVKSCLSLILKKFLKGKAMPKSNEKDNCFGRAQIAENLQNDGMEKCSAKLSEVLPRLRIQRLTTKQVNAERQKIHFIGHRSRCAVKKVEETCDPATSYNNDDCHLDYSDQDMETGAFEQPTISLSAEEEYPTSLGTGKVKVGQESGEIVPVSCSSKAVAVTSSPQSRPAEKKYTRNNVTGKYKCGRCTLEFNSSSACFYHYNSVHLEAKFKCNLCGKEFTQRHTFQRHHKSVHLGVRFKCLGCNREFRYRSDLTTHQRISSCGVKLSK